ncbi:MAG TPA: valine--tRNA ligase [Actinomycetota bacterium]|nr:valine--tRNA ligase [Actinomycetota bacterium]
MGTELPKAYDPATVESRLYDTWEAAGLFEPHGDGQPFCIVLPPPNVTGSLHMGHALDHSLQDAIVRRKRMQGFRVLWLPGTDHAGIATQNVVERELAGEGLSRHDLGRDAFLERVWAWKEKSGSRITHQMRRLGDSCAWSYERFTMDEGLSRAVREIFVRWYERGLIYRGNRITNWCPRCHTALSDIEVEHRDVDGELVQLRYPLSDGSGHMTIATTRVETMLGDTAVAVHPDDERYKDLIGKTVTLPLVGREIPIIADEAIEMEFGTGALKVTPAHDPVDFEIGRRHGLDAINVLSDDGTVNELGADFAGQDRFEARKNVLEALRSAGAVGHEERPFTHAVGHCYRCGTEVEPWLSEQWFVKIEPLATPAIAAVKDGRTRYVPERYARNYLDWMENLRDWCISRQLWWGHRIPVWYCENGHQFASRTDPDACAECASASIRQDEDVLDTWFSSALWPFSTLGWPDDTEELRTFYPNDVLVTGYDIITFWVSRMMMDGIDMMGDVPFRDVHIHGMVRDFRGKKMSKSFGNVMDPLDLIERYGADATRMTLFRSAVLGGDVPVSEQWVEGDRNFANKLWNLTRFVLMYAGEPQERPLPPADRQTVADRWILARLAAVTAEADAAMEGYDFATAAVTLRNFAWNDFADWYVEWSKGRLQGGSEDQKQDTLAILTHVLSATLRLLHPIMPFVTEELHGALSGTATILRGPWPAALAAEAGAVERFEFLKQIVAVLRRFRADHKVPPQIKPAATVVVRDETMRALLQSELERVRVLGSWGEIALAAAAPDATGEARIVLAAATIHVPLAGVLDIDAEVARLRREIGDLEAEASKIEAKLANESFVAKAPEEVVEKQRERVAEARAAIGGLAEALAELTA